MSHDLPFQGLRVVDVSQGLAGPGAAMMLAQYGAEVFKVEPLDGDWSRHRGAGGDGISSLLATTNLGKRSIALDLKKPHGGAVLRRLVERADVFVESFRPGVIGRLGFGYEEISKLNPQVVYLSVSGFGQKGPLNHRPATDTMLQAFSGIMAVNKCPVDDLPHRVPCWPIDIVTGIYAFQAIAVALYARRDTNCGRYIDASLLQGAVGLQAVRIVDHVIGGAPEAPVSGFPFPLGAFRVADGWVNLSVMKDGLWPSFCRAIGRADLGADPSLARARARRERAAELMPIIEEALLRLRSDDICALLQNEGALCEAVQGYEQMLAHPQTEATSAFTWLDQPGLGRVPFPNVPGPLPLEPGNSRSMVPALGGHTREILVELGYAAGEIAELLAEDAVRDTCADSGVITT